MESNLQSESRSDQSQPSPVRSPSSGSGWPLKNITKRFASRKNHEHSSEESTKRQEPVSNQSKTSVVLKKHGASRLGSKSSSGRKHSDTDVTPRTRLSSREQGGTNGGKSDKVISKSRLTSASTKLSFCFTAHCITSAVDSPSSTIQSIKGGNNNHSYPHDYWQETPDVFVHDEDIASWYEHSSEHEDSSVRGDNLSRSPYECPICFEQYQFDFEDHVTSTSGAQMGASGGTTFQEQLTSFRDHLPRLMQCGHTLCSKCLGKLGEDMSAKVLGFVKCPICREMHYTEPVESGMQMTVPDFDTSRDPNSDGIAGNEGGAGGSGGVQTGANQFVFRVNYALLSAIEHNLMHISAEELAHPHIDPEMDIDDKPQMSKTLERGARHRKTYSMYEPVANKINTCSTAKVGGAGNKREATHVTFEDIQKMLRPELIISQQHLSAINMTSSPMSSRADSERTITAGDN